MIELKEEFTFVKGTKNFDLFASTSSINKYYAPKGKFDTTKSIVVTYRMAD